jgi:hypothetical protein
MAKKRKRIRKTTEEWARWGETEERLELLIQRSLRERDPEAAALRERLFPVSRGSGPRARAARRALWQQGRDYMERVLDRIRAEEASRHQSS